MYQKSKHLVFLIQRLHCWIQRQLMSTTFGWIVGSLVFLGALTHVSSRFNFLLKLLGGVLVPSLSSSLSLSIYVLYFSLQSADVYQGVHKMRFCHRHPSAFFFSQRLMSVALHRLDFGSYRYVILDPSSAAIACTKRANILSFSYRDCIAEYRDSLCPPLLAE